MEAGEIQVTELQYYDGQNMVWNVDSAPQEEPVSAEGDMSAGPDLRIKKFLVISKIKSVMHSAVGLVLGFFTVMLQVRTGEDEGQRSIEDIELSVIHTVVSNEEDPDSNEANQSMAFDIRLNQPAVTSNSKSVIQLTVALVLAGGSFGVMFQVPGGVNELGRAVMGETIGFNLLLVADTLTFLASLVVAMTVATASHISAKVQYLIRMNLWAAAVCFVLTFLAAAYVVVFWCSLTIALALLVYHIAFPQSFTKYVGTSWDGFLRSFL